MDARTYVRVPYAWNATVDTSAGQPARYLASLVKQSLRYGRPAARRGGRWLAMLARHDLPPTRVLTSSMRRRRTSRADLDRLVADVAEAWPSLRETSDRLPDEPPALSSLELARASARTILLFGAAPDPLVVVKFPGDAEVIESESAVLALASEAGVAPRPLGSIGEGSAQEGLPGRALRVDAVSLDDAPRLPRRDDVAALIAGLARLARTSAVPWEPAELVAEMLAPALSHPLPARVRSRAEEAIASVASLGAAALKHGDTSAQNCLFDDGNLSGLVDWEGARRHGAPGFDVWNLGVALLDHGVGLRYGQEDATSAAFAAAWSRSAFFTQIREGARSAALAAGVGEERLDDLEIAFFVRRLAHRATTEERFATGARTAAAMLEVACVS